MKQRMFAMPAKVTFAAPCKWMTKHIEASHLSRFDYRVIVNGVNLEVFKPTHSTLREKYDLEGKKICLSVASEWDRRKGLPFLINAAQKLGDEYAFVVIGLTAEQIAKLPTGMIGLQNTADTHELAAWYTTADCLVNPTLEDNMPMVNLEALACGTPVVVFETGGCPEAINEKCGYVVPQQDENALLQAIEQACSGRFSPAECIKRAEHFDCKQTFLQYLSLYKELIP